MSKLIIICIVVPKRYFSLVVKPGLFCGRFCQMEQASWTVEWRCCIVPTTVILPCTARLVHRLLTTAATYAVGKLRPHYCRHARVGRPRTSAHVCAEEANSRCFAQLPALLCNH